MKLRMKTYQIALLALLLVSSVAVLPALAQKKIEPITADLRQEEGVCKGAHRSRKDFYKNVRMLEPASVLEIKGNRLNYAVAGEGIDLGSFDLESGYSVVPKGFDAEHHQGCYGILYCEKHLIILGIEVLESKQCGLSKS